MSKTKTLRQIIEESPSSLFTKQDILNLIDEEEKNANLKIDDVVEALSDVIDGIDFYDYLDLSSVRLFMQDNNQVELDWVEINKDELFQSFVEDLKNTLALSFEDNNPKETVEQIQPQIKGCGNENCGCKKKKKNKKQ